MDGAPWVTPGVMQSLVMDYRGAVVVVAQNEAVTKS